MTHPAKTPPSHAVAVDTNVLWHSDKAEVVDPEFIVFLEEHVAKMELQLVVPSIVRGELLFQQTMSALKALRRANKNLERVSAITSKGYSHRVTENRVRREVAERLDGWLAANQAVVADVPIDEVDWPSIIHRAIWREPPFTYDEKNIVVEKGFRDALILEAVCAYCDQDPDKYFAFICEDRVLREAAEVRIGHLDYSAIYESIGEFAAFIRLTQENLKEEFVRSIRDRARAKFFTRKDQTCLLMRENLISRINKEFRRAMRPGDSSEAIENIFEEPEWEPTEGGVFRLGSTQFVRLRDPRDFHWITELHYVRPYRPKGGEDDLFSLLTGDRLLMLRIGVHWHAEVRSNGAFYGTAVDELELLERQFHTSTEKRREEYGLSSSA